MSGASAAACGDDETVRFDDGEAEAGASDAANASSDELDANARADVEDSTLDAGPFDAAVREVSCESASCATALTHVLPTSGSEQGFCARLHDATVACWGANSTAQLGNGLDAGVSSANPQRVVGLSNVVSLNGMCAIDEDGAAWCWGYGAYLHGAYASFEWAPVKLPIPAATQVSGETVYNKCALIEGKPVCWGLGATLLPPTAVYSGVTGFAPIAIPMPAGASGKDILVLNQAAFVLRDDGTVVSWGENPGLGRVTSIIPDINPDLLPLENVTNISGALSNACAVADGIAYCWGTAAPPADPASLDRSLPEPVATPERVVQISNTDHFATLPRRWCAVGGSGAVYCWGNNANGQAGDGTTQYAMTPVNVPLPAPAVHVETTADSTCALLVNGKVLCWGGNYYGQLGNGKARVQSVVPVEVLLP